MRDRGETVADIAQLGGCSVKLVRRFLKELQAAARLSGTASGNGLQALRSDGLAVSSDVSQAQGVSAKTRRLRSNRPRRQLMSVVSGSVG